MKKKSERAEFRPPVMRLCSACADRMNTNRPGMLTRLGEEEPVACSWCGAQDLGGRWELWPEPRRRYARRSGGGERARAGRA